MLELVYAVWFGILTTISPCPLATNIAAVSFLSKKGGNPRAVLISSFSYILGRMLTYAVIASIIIGSVASIPSAATFLQAYMNRIIGPVLIIVGFFLLGIIRLRIPSLSLSQEKLNKLAESGVIGAFLLGMLFALSFCPIAAGLFFGSLIPLALRSDFGMVHPFFYGLGTGIPVAILAIAVAFGMKSFSKFFQKTSKFELWTRTITAAIFIIIGAYFTWTYLIVLYWA